MAEETQGMTEEVQEELQEETTEETQEEIQEESQEEVQEEVLEETPPKKKQTAQARIDEITWQRREAEREAEYWKDLALQTAKPESKDGRPRPEDFEANEDYEDALIGWHDQQRAKKAQEASEKRAVQKAVTGFNEKAAPLRKQYDDFDKAIEAPVFTDTMRRTIFAMEIGPEVAYHLGKNKETASKFKGLPPERQIYELYKLETQLKVAKETKTVTSAPSPVKPVGDTALPDKDPKDMTTEEWMKWDKQRELDKIRKRLGG